MAKLITKNTNIEWEEFKNLYIDEEFVAKFKTLEDCKKPYYNIYAYLDVSKLSNTNKELNVKVGWAKDGIFKRYKGQDATHPWQRVIGLWHVDSDTVADKEIHNHLKELSNLYKKDNLYHWNENVANKNNKNVKIKGSHELYVIESVEGINQLLNDISSFLKTDNVKETRKLYKDIRDLVVEIKEMEERNNIRNNILYLCTRWGKTNTILELSKLHNDVDNVRITIMAAYVGTVRNSYKQNCATLKNYSNILFVDPDDYDTEEELFNVIKNHLMADPKNHVMFYVALTGNMTVFNRRISVLKNLDFVEKELVIEEADFGSHCDLQLNKIKKMEKMNISYNYITTGTGWDKVKKISDLFDNVQLYKREYLKDVLGAK